MKKLVMALVPFLMIGCGDPEDANGDGIADGVQEPNNVSVVVPATPKGTVSGQVLTSQQKPLAATTVALTVGSSTTPKTTTTDEAGNFTFQDVPGGAQVLLTFTKEGYATMRASATVPTTAGNVPINDGNVNFGPVVLSQTNATLTFTLIGPSGRPAQGVNATLKVTDAGIVLFGSASWTSSVVVAEATADAQGVVTFTNVPNLGDIDRMDGTYELTVSAHDENGDGVLESNGLFRSYTGRDLIVGANVRPLSLGFAYDPSTSLAIDFSNLGVLSPQNRTLPQYNMIKSGESIHIVFNQPVQNSSIIVGLTDEYGKENLSINKALTNGGTVLTLSPQGVQPGKEYNLYVRAVSVNGGTAVQNTVAFFGGDLAQPQSIAIDNIRFQDSTPVGTTTINGRLDVGERVYVNFNQAMSFYGAEQVYVLFNADIDGVGGIGNIPGEVGNKDGTGFLLAEDEPLAPIRTKTPAEEPVFTIYPSGFTTRFSFTFTGTRPLDPASFPGGLPVVLAFSGIDAPSASGYESAWGVSQIVDLSGNIFNTSAIPPHTP